MLLPVEPCAPTTPPRYRIVRSLTEGASLSHYLLFVPGGGVPVKRKDSFCPSIYSMSQCLHNVQRTLRGLAVTNNKSKPDDLRLFCRHNLNIDLREEKKHARSFTNPRAPAASSLPENFGRLSKLGNIELPSLEFFHPVAV